MADAFNVQGPLHVPRYLGRKRRKPTLAKSETLYVNRPVTNAKTLTAWAKTQGFPTTLADDLHVTIAFSKTPVDWDEFEVLTDSLTLRGGERSLERFGDAVVLRFESPKLEGRWQEFIDDGASWDHDGYKPHVTISWNAPDLDLDKVVPYRGPIVLGAEEFAPVKEDWKDDVVEKYDPNQPRDPDGRWTSEGGYGKDIVEDFKQLDPTDYLFRRLTDIGEKSGTGSWSENEKNAITKYTTVGGEDINFALRNMGEEHDEYSLHMWEREQVEYMDSALEKASLAQDLTVFRTISKATLDRLESNVGGIYEDKGYVSTTASVPRAKMEGTKIKDSWVEIELPKGSKAAPVAHLSDFKGEMEVLTARNSKFKVRRLPDGEILLRMMP